MKYTTEPLFLDSKNALYKLISSIAGIIFLLYGVLNFFVTLQFDLASIEMVFGMLNLYFFWVAKKGKVLNWQPHISLFSISFSIIYAFSIAGFSSGTIYWVSLLPLIFCLIVSPKISFIYTLTLYFIISYLLYMNTDNDISYLFVINFSGPYFLAYTIFAFYKSQNLKRKQLLHTMAFEDPLTGSRNRHALKALFDDLNQESKQSNRQQQNTRLLIIDIDHFKSVNDEFGHAVGDEVLINISALLLSHTNDKQVYRVGGEEFLIVLNNKTFKQTYELAEKIRQDVENTVFNAYEHKIKITVSIGLAQVKKGQDFRSFLHNADKNLYSAKSKGRNLVHYDTSNLNSLDDNKELEESL